MERRSDSEITVNKVEVTEKEIRIYDSRNNEITINYSDIHKIGIERRFNRVLVLLTISISITLLITMNGVYLILTLILFIATLINRNEILIISYKMGVLKIRGLRKAELNAIINNIRNSSTH